MLARSLPIAKIDTRPFLAGFPGTQQRMQEQTPAEHELAELIVDSLNLENTAAAAIAPDAPLFGGGLGLDSIDALELALAISKRYGFSLRSDNPDNKRIFSSLRELSAHVQSQRKS